LHVMPSSIEGSMAYQQLNRAEEAKAKYPQGLRQLEKAFGVITGRPL